MYGMLNKSPGQMYPCHIMWHDIPFAKEHRRSQSVLVTFTVPINVLPTILFLNTFRATFQTSRLEHGIF